MKTKKPEIKATDNIFKYLLLLGLLGGLLLHSFWRSGLINQTLGLILPKASAQIKASSASPDWSQIKFSNLILSSDGSVTYPTDKGDETRTWKAGQNVATFMKLGDFENSGLNIDQLSLTNISQSLGRDLSNFKLSDFGVIKTQTLASLVKAIPNLANQQITSVAPISDMFSRLGISTTGTIGNALQQSQLDNVQIGNVIDLSPYNLTSIPGIQNASINQFTNWQDTVISQVPGLSDLPWSQFNSGLNSDLSFVAQVDLPLGELEANRVRTVSGSTVEGFNVPCNQNNCAHIELSGSGLITGTQWISGKDQKVKGGFGILKLVNHGLEPTGRHPFGSAFKQVVWDLDEANGAVNTTMFFRFCKTLPFTGRTCTPYFIGPVPFIVYHEKDTIILGRDS